LFHKKGLKIINTHMMRKISIHYDHKVSRGIFNTVNICCTESQLLCSWTQNLNKRCILSSISQAINCLTIYCYNVMWLRYISSIALLGIAETNHIGAARGKQKGSWRNPNFGFLQKSIALLLCFLISQDK